MTAGTQLAIREPNYPRYPKTSGDTTRWWTTHRNWHISSGEADDAGRPPVGNVMCEHDADDKPARTFWASSLEDAVAKIDAMPDYGDWDGDYD